MEVLRSYVVRIYRQAADGVTGVIESVETSGVQCNAAAQFVTNPSA
jgi:hypothetical protein